MSDIRTPNDTEFSIGAKIYLCADKLFQPAGITFGYPTPAGTRVDNRELTKCVLASTLDWLEANGYVQLWASEKRYLIGSAPVLMVRAVHSGAPGLSGHFLEATRWVDTDLVTLCARLLPREQAPFIGFLDRVSQEYASAGVLTRGGYAAHGNVWNPEWLGYLHDAFYPEVYGAWERSGARPDRAVIDRNVMLAVAERQHTPDDRFDD